MEIFRIVNNARLFCQTINGTKNFCYSPIWMLKTKSTSQTHQTKTPCPPGRGGSFGMELHAHKRFGAVANAFVGVLEMEVISSRP
jgi:hypothetical protein